jgi:hypothetical protein
LNFSRKDHTISVTFLNSQTSYHPCEGCRNKVLRVSFPPIKCSKLIDFFPKIVKQMGVGSQIKERTIRWWCVDEQSRAREYSKHQFLMHYLVFQIMFLQFCFVCWHRSLAARETTEWFFHLHYLTWFNNSRHNLTHTIGTSSEEAHWKEFHMHTTGFEPRTWFQVPRLGYTSKPSPQVSGILCWVLGQYIKHFLFDL